MRETYIPACQETVNILGSNRQGIADEAAFTPNTIDQILAGNAGDPFLHFYRYYSACVRAGVDVEAWDAKLSSVKVRAVGGVTNTQCLSELIGRAAKAAQTWALANDDGVIEDHEAPGIRRSITKLRDIADVIESRLPENERKAKVASVIRGRFNGGGK